MNLRPFSSYIHGTLPYLAPGMFLLVLPITHTVAMRLSMLLITLVMASVTFAKGDRHRPPCLMAWMLWLAVALFSLTTATDLSYSIGEIKTEIGYGMIAFFSFYVLTRQWQHFVTLTSVTLIGFWILGSAALFDYYEKGVWQVDSFYGGVGDFSSYLVTLLPLLLLLAYRQQKSHPALTLSLSIFSCILFLLVAYSTLNLMIWFSLVLQLLTLLLLAVQGRAKLIISVIVVGLALSLVIAVGIQKARIGELTPQGVASLFTKDPRLQHWRHVTDIISQQPFRGDGFGRATLTKAHPEIRITKQLWHSHNIFLDAAVQMGLQGALILALLFGCLVWHFNRLRQEQDRDLQAIGIVGLVLLVGVLSKNMTDNFFYRHLSLMFWTEVGLLLGLARGLMLQRASNDEVSRSTVDSPQTP
jgi:O-antigen ligase